MKYVSRLKVIVIVSTGFITILKIDDHYSKLLNDNLNSGITLLLAIVIIIFTIKYDDKEAQKKKYSANTGKLDGRTNYFVIPYPGIKIGSHIYVPSSTNKSDTPIPGLDLKIWSEDGNLFLTTTTRDQEGNKLQKLLRMNGKRKILICMTKTLMTKLLRS